MINIDHRITPEPPKPEPKPKEPEQEPEPTNAEILQRDAEDAVATVDAAERIQEQLKDRIEKSPFGSDLRERLNKAKGFIRDPGRYYPRPRRARQ